VSGIKEGTCNTYTGGKKREKKEEIKVFQLGKTTDSF